MGKLWGLLLFSLVLPLSVFASEAISYVDTRIGTQPAPTALQGTHSEKTGNTQPTMVASFGMIQWGPDTSRPDAATYYYDDQEISGFSLTHLSGTGCANGGELSIMPSTSEQVEAQRFDHSRENAQAGYYSVQLANQVQVELTGTERTGLGRFTFPEGSSRYLRIDSIRTATGRLGGGIQDLDDRRLTGWVAGGDFCGTGNEYKVFYAIEFDQPFEIVEKSDDGVLVKFGSRTPIQLKVGISYVSELKAMLNSVAEIPGWSFEQVRADAQALWNQSLSRIEVEGGSEAELRKFYTALYHSLLHPNIASDVDGDYTGFDQKLHFTGENGASQKVQFANFSGWDIYRSQIQLLAFLMPGRTSEIIQSLINDGKVCGALPKWAHNQTETGVMIGDPGVAIVASAFALGATRFDTAAALALMKKSGLNPGTECGGYETRPGLQEYLSLGYVPQNLGWFKETASASTTLEYTSADFAVSQFAAALGDFALSRVFLDRSAKWKNLFDNDIGYIHPRLRDGGFTENFDIAGTRGFTEGNSAQYTWMVPFDVKGLFDKMGGEKVVVPRLDSFFGLLNSYHLPNLWIGNEIGFSSPWLYHWAGIPEKSEALITRIMEESFSDQPSGLPGNDDMGALSSWYVWSALGLYPAIPGVGGFVIGKPHFTKITLHLENGSDLVITGTSENSESNDPKNFVQSLCLNGAPLERSWIPFSRIQNGGKLDFRLGPGSTSWGKGPEGIPPSYAEFRR